ncbi:MAG: 2-C-methyl-D-erythritol 2,4-cyclodiphosphate synthase [Deltaproteobacteria bacterium]|nr:2-C-methyl-D-erythritol 2,4-cyclodiphosphate synthase [Deltaproteobacteria bacterium]
MTRIGQGWDIHRLVEGRPLRLAGVTVPFARGLLGHSDGDVVLHAVTDALLGALALGDIGQHFPDTDPTFRGADSGVLLGRIVALVAAQGARIGNVDVSVLAEQPKLAPHMPAMRARLAELLQLDETRVGLKAKTMEGLGAIGAGEAIAALAVALLEEAPRRHPLRPAARRRPPRSGR